MRRRAKESVSSGVGDMEFRARAVRMVMEVCPDYETEWAAIGAIAAKLGDGSSERSASGSSGRDRRGQRPGMTGQEPAEIGRPRGEVREPRRANEILKAASAFCPRQSKNEGSASSGQPPRITTAKPGRVRGEGAADAVMRRSGEKVATRLRLPRFAARHEAIETLMSGPGVSAGRTFPAGMGP